MTLRRLSAPVCERTFILHRRWGCMRACPRALARRAPRGRGCAGSMAVLVTMFVTAATVALVLGLGRFVMLLRRPRRFVMLL
jgi:hypothetical protein